MTDPTNIYAPKAGKISRATKSESQGFLFTQDFFVCFFSLVMLTASGVWGTKAIAAFLLPWPIIVVRHMNEAKLAIIRNRVLYLIPVWALFSTFWSSDRAWTLRAAVQLTVTITIAILAGACVKRRAFLASVLFSFVVGAMLSLVAGNYEIISYTGEVAFAGIYGSKNAFSGAMALLLLIAFALYMDKKQPKLLRASALSALLLTPFMLYHGRSLGTIVAVCFTIAVYFLFRYLRNYHRHIRLLAVTAIFILIVVATVVLVVLNMNPLDALTEVGKDATLTGRTWLWSHAMNYIAERPIQGDGYEAFWRVSNPRAQELWYGFHVPAGSGLGFHNEYIAMTVDLGIVGLIIMVSYFWIMGKRVGIIISKDMTAERIFCAVWFIMYIIRTPIETAMFGQFNINMILFCVIWIYLRPDAVPQKPLQSLLNRPRKNLNESSRTTM